MAVLATTSQNKDQRNRGESRAEVVEEALGTHCRCSAANWSEVAQKVIAAGRDWSLVSALMDSYGIRVESVTRDDAEWAAGRWVRSEGMSLADRLCLALGERYDEPVLTADVAWGSEGRVRQIR